MRTDGRAGRYGTAEADRARCAHAWVAVHVVVHASRLTAPPGSARTGPPLFSVLRRALPLSLCLSLSLSVSLSLSLSLSLLLSIRLSLSFSLSVRISGFWITMTLHATCSRCAPSSPLPDCARLRSARTDPVLRVSAVRQPLFWWLLLHALCVCPVVAAARLLDQPSGRDRDARCGAQVHPQVRKGEKAVERKFIHKCGKVRKLCLSLPVNLRGEWGGRGEGGKAVPVFARNENKAKREGGRGGGEGGREGWER